ncbi:MAG: hypothetical protein AB2689_04940 [Candidatus Thiodiazotropha taylori]
MDQYSYQETKNDVISLMNETVENGSSIGGGLGRAEVEYWLGPLELNEPDPTPYSLKLLAVVSIGSLRQANNLEVDNLYTVVETLLVNMNAADILAIEPDSINQLVCEATEAFGESLANKIKSVVALNA